MVANNNIRSFTLEIKNDRCKIDFNDFNDFNDFTSVVFSFQYEASYIIIDNQTISPT